MVIPRRFASFRVMALAAALVVAAPTRCQSARRPELGLTQAWLKNLSTWQQHLTQPEGQPVDKRRRGVWPIGDGHVFTYLGLGRRANTMQALTGPHYQTAEVNAPKGHFGELSLDLVENGKTVALTTQSLWRTRGVNCVITEDAGSGLSLLTVNWAARPSDALFRWVEVRNRSDAPHRVVVRASWERGTPGPKARSLTAAYAAKGFAAELAASLPAKAGGHDLTVDLGDVPAGAVKSFVLTLRTRRSNAAFAVEPLTKETAAASLAACADFWRERLAGTTTTRSDDRRLADLLEDWKVMMLVQRSEPSGAVSPMVNYRGSWVRDNVGPMLAFLRYGMFDEARAILDWVYDATLVTGRLNNHVPLDLDVSKAREIEKTVRWGDLKIANTELPAWIILQHEWYYRATWDIDFIMRRWPFLSVCYQAMKPDQRGTLPTHGDETYLHGAFFSLFPDRVGPNCFLPADTPDRRARSFDSSVLYLMSINAMGEMIEDIEKAQAGAAARQPNWGSRRKAAYDQYHLTFLQRLEQTFWLPREKRFAPFVSPITGEPHRAPYGPVNLRPQWIGYTYAIGEKNRENLKSTLGALWKKGVRIGMTPTVGYSTGHLQGLAVLSLCDLDDARRGDAVRALVDLAGPAGEWAELYDPEGRPVGGYDRDWPNRCRPWESGVNIDALFFALNGIRYACCPGWSKKDQRYKLRTPPGADWLAMTRVRHDGHDFSIYLDPVYERDLKIDKTGLPVRKMRFRMNWNTINYAAGNLPYVDAAINVGETLYVRYPTLIEPLFERDAWPIDKEKMLEPGDGPGTFVPPVPRVTPGRKTLVLTARAGVEAGNAQVVDVGLPMTPETIAGLLLERGKPRFERCLIDFSAREVSRATFKKHAFWESPVLRKAFADFEKAGGKLIQARFIENWSVIGPFPVKSADALVAKLGPDAKQTFRTGTFKTGDKELTWRLVRSDGPIDFGRSLGTRLGRSISYAATILVSDRDRECILKLGSDDGCRVTLNGTVVLTRNRVRTLRPDDDSLLVKLKKGANRLLIKVYNAGGPSAVAARLTDLDGVPLAGVESR